MKPSIKDALMAYGVFPETLPPCFTTEDWKKAFRGLTQIVVERQYYKKRYAEAILYNGTKHDGNRRPYSTPHIVPYYSVCNFINRNWKTFQRRFTRSEYSLSTPQAAEPGSERAIMVTPLSEIASRVGKKIRYAPYVLRADIAQFYPSIYTHAIAWAAHGKQKAKDGRMQRERANRFNNLDLFVQNAQSGQTRGVLIGPDAYRIIAEFIAVQVDEELKRRASHIIIGAARHVDDYYIGVRSEAEAAVALSHLRAALYEFELHVNDLKTSIIRSTKSLDDAWAARLRLMSDEFEFDRREERITSFLNEAIDQADITRSQSPIKLAVRRLDRYDLYLDPYFDYIEAYLQRMVAHFPHAIDYICLVLVKRYALGEPIDDDGWAEVVNDALKQHLLLGNHHEACWLLWLGIVCRLSLNPSVLELAPKYSNAHLMAMLIHASVIGKIDRAPKLHFSNKISSSDRTWLVNLVARATEFTKAPFSGPYTEECEHLASNGLVLVDFDKHLATVAAKGTKAIRNTRFGYEDTDRGDDDEEDDDSAKEIFPFDPADQF